MSKLGTIRPGTKRHDTESAETIRKYDAGSEKKSWRPFDVLPAEN
jgi:hypothetical protein